MASGDHLIDTLFDGRYLIIRKLGSGGMANVYLAMDQELGRRVAIKILDDRHARDEQFVERFRREAQNAAGLSHPNIVSIYDRGDSEGTYYIAMEHVEGRTLKELLVARGPSPLGIAIDYTRQILSALRFAHRNGIVHRDIKPHNVIVDGEGRVKVMDFGIARAGAASQMTEAGSIIGTAQYLSPEQARGAAVDQRSDLYSVGVVLYEMLTGTTPFSGESPVEIAMKHLSDPPRPPSVERPDIPPDLDMIVLRALAKNPDDRFQTAEEMDAELERVARGAGVTTQTADAATAVLSGTALSSAPTAIVPPRRPPAATRPGYRYAEPPPRRRPFWPWLLALLLVVLAGVAGWYAYGQIQDSLGGDATASVPFVVGQREDLAVKNILEKGLEPNVNREPHETVKIGEVFEQSPDGGVRVDKGGVVDIRVSTGPPKVEVPSLVGKSRDDAFVLLTEAKLKAKPREVFSKEEPGTVIAQHPVAGEMVLQGSTVQINISKGVQPLTVPNVVGQQYDSAAGQLQGQGFAVARRDVDSSQPKDTVIDQQPKGGSELARGGTVILYVSKGPKESTIPDVTSQDEASATQTLEQSGFSVDVQEQDTTDPNQDGIVLSQDPPGGTKAKPGTTVTIVVGRLVPIP